jgi:hypothetical protein
MLEYPADAIDRMKQRDDMDIGLNQWSQFW